MLDDVHAERADLEVQDDAVELREAREAEEHVDDVGRQLRVLPPVLAQDAGEGTHHRLCGAHRAALL